MSSRSGQSDVDRVREASDLVALIGEHVALTPKGREHVGLCPFHDDHSPSMCVVTHKGNAFFKCHACGAAGDAFSFVMNYHKKDFGEALRYLADRAGLTLERTSAPSRRPGEAGRTELRAVTARAAEHFRRTLAHPAHGERARTALAERGVSDEMVEQFKLGAAPAGTGTLLELLRQASRTAGADLTAHAAQVGLLKQRHDGGGYFDAFRNRLVFPICDELGQPVAFGCRCLDPDDHPKYLNSSQSVIFEKSKVLYGLDLARRAIIDSGEAIVTEGYTDVIACHQAGLRNVVGTLGTALTAEHARLLSRLCDVVVLVFDGDEAGQRAADRAVEVFFREPVDIRICVLPDGQDPDELLRRPGGAERFCTAVEDAADALSFKVGRFTRRLGEVSSIAGQEKLLNAFLAELANLGFHRLQSVRRRWVLNRLAELLDIPVEAVARAVPAARPGRPRRPGPTAGPDTIDAAAGAPGGLAPTRPLVRRASRARRLAEHDLLGILIFEPELARTEIELGGERRPVLEHVRVEDFSDETAAAVAAVLIPALRERGTITVAALMEALGADVHRGAAASLYFVGERLCGPEPSGATVVLNEAAAALYKCLRDEAYRRHVSAVSGRSADEKVHALQELLERRREQGDMAAAIGQGVRG